jgi:CrcB protein
VNLIGGLAMGLLAGALGGRGGSDQLRLLLGVGVLGGFTTFSAFSLDAVRLLETGQTGAALGYIAASVLGSLLLTATGLLLVRAT